MRYARNEEGMALVMSLILAVITLAFSAALIYMVTQGTRMSGLEKRYATALDAAKGGVEVILGAINDGGYVADSNITVENFDCLNEKLNKKTEYWNKDYTTDPPGDLAYCTLPNATWTNAKEEPDITFSLGSGKDQYNLYLKIIDTVKGNSGPVYGGGTGGGSSGGMGKGFLNVSAVVGSPRAGGSSSGITTMHIPYLYAIEVWSERVTASSETDSASKLTLLYAH